MKNNLGRKIEVIRKELGLTMKEFGERFYPSASDSIVSRWERNVSKPSNERLKVIAELGNVSVESLLGVIDLEEENARFRQALEQIAHGDTWTAHPHDIAAWALGWKDAEKQNTQQNGEDE